MCYLKLGFLSYSEKKVKDLYFRVLGVWKEVDVFQRNHRVVPFRITELIFSKPQ